jgi:hypothetical protein
MTVKTFKKEKHCLMCNKLFEYTQPTTKYCSNACKCRSYQIRVKAGQKVKHITPSIDPPEEFMTDSESYVEQIEQLTNYVKYLHTQIHALFQEKSQEREQLMEAHIKQIQTLHDHYQRRLGEVSSPGQVDDQGINENMVVALANIAEAFFKK